MTKTTPPTTPLPGWEINPAFQTEAHSIVISERTSKRTIVTVCTEHPVDATVEEEDRAKLICALPELIGAAMTAFYALRTTIANEPGNCVGSVARDAFKLLSDALQKAGLNHSVRCRESRVANAIGDVLGPCICRDILPERGQS